MSNADVDWFYQELKDMGAQPAKGSPYKNEWVIDKSKALELTKFFAREFNIVKDGGGWWHHKTRWLTARFIGYRDKPDLYVSAIPRTR